MPRRNLVGKKGRGFYQTMANFNFERWGMIVGGNRHSRMVCEECFKWASQRKVFGKTLISQPMIRFKLAQMIAEVESVHSMLEDVTYQMTKMSEEEIHQYLAGYVVHSLTFTSQRNNLTFTSKKINKKDDCIVEISPNTGEYTRF